MIRIQSDSSTAVMYINNQKKGFCAGQNLKSKSHLVFTFQEWSISRGISLSDTWIQDNGTYILMCSRPVSQVEGAGCGLCVLQVPKTNWTGLSPGEEILWWKPLFAIPDGQMVSVKRNSLLTSFSVAQTNFCSSPWS